MKKENSPKNIGIQTLDDAVKMLKDLSKSKFVGSVDIDILLNLKEKQKKEIIRGSVTLPNSLGDDKKVIVFAEENEAKEALKAGAIKAGLEKLVDEVLGGFHDFDIVIATPNVMGKLVKLGKFLGPKGLMPNPKNGTITTDITKAVESFKSGRINFKSQPDHGVIRMKIAKVDMDVEKIKENIIVLLKSVFNETKKLSASPFKQVVIKPTMGSGVKIDTNDIMKLI